MHKQINSIGNVDCIWGIIFVWINTNAQVLLITGGGSAADNFSSTEVSLQNHLMKMCLGIIGNIWRQTIVKRSKKPDY